VNLCQNETAVIVRTKNRDCNKYLKTLERVKGIEPSSSAWKAIGKPSPFKAS
jgi:hypothetical protein